MLTSLPQSDWPAPDAFTPLARLTMTFDDMGFWLHRTLSTVNSPDAPSGRKSVYQTGSGAIFRVVPEVAQPEYRGKLVVSVVGGPSRELLEEFMAAWCYQGTIESYVQDLLF